MDLLATLDEFAERHSAAVTIRREGSERTRFWLVDIRFGGTEIARTQNDSLRVAIERALMEAGAV